MIALHNHWHKAIGAVALVLTIGSAAGCATTRITPGIEVKVPPHVRPRPVAATTPITYSCTTGWTPQPFSSDTTSQLFTAGPEPAWGAPAPATYGNMFEYPAWKITATSNTDQPIMLGTEIIAYYTAAGTEIGSETGGWDTEALTSHQTLTTGGTSQIQPTGATSCAVVGGQP